LMCYDNFLLDNIIEVNNEFTIASLNRRRQVCGLQTDGIYSTDIKEVQRSYSVA